MIGAPTANERPVLDTSWPWRVFGWVLFAIVPLGLLFAAVAPHDWVVGAAEGGIACPFRAVTGLPCPFCNMTHATFALGQGDWRASLAYHPLGPLVLLLWLWASTELGRRRPSRLIRHAWAPAVLGVLVAIIWVVNLAH